MSAKTSQKPPKQPSTHGSIAWMASNNVAANLLMLVLLVGGLIVGAHIKQEVFPEFDSDIVSVSIAYPGASPEEVERGVVIAVEQAIQGLEGIDEITSTASEGHASIRVEALEGADVQRLWQEIKSEVDNITTLPDETEDPNVSIESRRHEVVRFALYGGVGEMSLREVADNLRDALLANPGITQVEFEGARDMEIHVEISQENLRRYGLTLSDVAKRISSGSVELGGGSMRTRQGEILVRVTDRRDWASEFANIPVIAGEGGAKVYLGDIATISEGFEDTNAWASWDGQQAVLVEVYRVGDQTPIEVSAAAQEVAAEFSLTLPSTVHLAMLRDSSDIFMERAELLLGNAYLGLSLVFIFLALFLEIRLAFWVSLGIPISFLGSFIFLSFTDFSINMITMFAFIITLGIVVDDAIVVGENVYYHRQRGSSFLRAAIEGAREVAGPVIFSVLTNVVAFLPMYFVPGMMGKVFKSIPLVVASVFTVSLIESLFVLPAHLGHGKAQSRLPLLNPIIRVQSRFSAWFEHMIYKNYGKLISKSLRRRYIVLAGGLALLIGTLGYALSGRMGIELFPKVESDYAFVNAVLPYGASRGSVERVQQRLIDAADKVVAEHGGADLSKGVWSKVEENEIEVRIFLTSPEIRPLGTAEVITLWRDTVGPLHGLESITYESDRGGPGGGKGLTVRLSHSNTEVLDTASEHLAESLNNFAVLSDIDDGSAKGKRQFDIKLTPMGEAVGITSSEVANQVRYAFLGAEALKQQRGRNEVTIRVRLPERERATEETLDALVIRLPDGKEMFLRDLATVTQGRAYTSITRSNSRRVNEVTANVTPRSAAEGVINELKQSVLPNLVNQYQGLTFSFEGRQADLRESMASLYEGLLLALIAIYALLAIPFRSYFQPLIIMFCIPFGIIGAVYGHMIMGYSLSLMSMFGVVALSGVVVNDSLVLIDFANRRVRAGEKPVNAIKTAGIQRFRPIMLTTVTTCGGLAPMILETSRQAKFLIPMAISLGFGILFATSITLLLVPALYMVLEDVHNLLGHRSVQPVPSPSRSAPVQEH